MNSDFSAARARLDAAEAKREEVLLRHIANGVMIESRTVEIDESVVIAPGAKILSGTILRGKTVIGAGCVIGPNSLIEDSTVDEGTTVNASQVYGSHLGPHNNIGPFTHVRVNTVTDYGVHLGAYVETKNSNFARGNTVSHLTYIGDSDVGKYCNFGCGTVTCNYDGKDKFRTTIGDYCFIGCNTIWWLRSRSATEPTRPPAAPSPKTCPRRRWASPGSARPIWTAGPSPRWRPTSPRNRSWKKSRISKLFAKRLSGRGFGGRFVCFFHPSMLY